MAKRIVLGEASRQAILHGVNKLANVVKVKTSGGIADEKTADIVTVAEARP